MRIVLILCFGLLSVPLVAQIVNVEGKRNQLDQEGWHGTVDLNFDLTQNTKTVLTLGARTNVQFLKGRHRVLLLADADRDAANGTNLVDRGYNHLRYNFEFGQKRRLAFEAFNQVQYNSVQLIQYRHLIGAGLRFSLYQTDSLKLWMGSLPMFEYEELTTDIVERNVRQSSYLFFFFARKKFEFQTINYYQPNLADFSDFRLTTGTTIELGILRWLRYVSTLDLTYDSKPPVEVPNVVFTLKNGIKLEF